MSSFEEGSGRKVGIKSWLIYEPRQEKTCLRGLRPVKTQTGFHSHRDKLEA